MNNEEYLKKMLQIRQAIKDGNSTWNDMNSFRIDNGKNSLSSDSIRRSFQILDEFIDGDAVKFSSNNYISTCGTNSDGSSFSCKILEIRDSEKNDARTLLKLHGFNPDNYILVNSKNSYWSSKSDGTTLYSSKISVKPKCDNDITFDDVDKFFKNYVTKPVLPIALSPRNDDSNDFLEIDIEDLHLGLLSYEPETGENYDINIAKDNYLKIIDQIFSKCKEKKFKKIIFASLGDILHVNNEQNTTLKGTKQDVDSRLSKMFDVTLELLIMTLEGLLQYAPVDVYSVVGNHDATTNYMLYKSLEMAFRENSNIKFYNSPNPRKYSRYGNVLLGWCHGDMPDKNLGDWLHTEAALEWGQTKYREVHCGHLHSIVTLVKQETENGGVIIRHLPTICGSSAWEHYQGYAKNLKTFLCFVWNEDTGLQEIWYNNIN